MLKLKNVRVHNLKSVSLELEENQLICFTGVSGSGKSSLAFDTIYVEGQRRYVESLSQHARRFIGELQKPDVEAVSGITPTISIEQKTAGRNPRSTVGTITEIYDYLRVLYARAGTAHCPISGEPVIARSSEEIIQEIKCTFQGKKLIILAPYLRAKKGELKDDFEAIIKKGFTRIRLDSKILLVSDEISLEKAHPHDVDIVIDRIEVNAQNEQRITESVLYALDSGDGSVIVYNPESDEERLYSTKAYSPKSDRSYQPLDPQDFSFNSPIGMCQDCQGMGVKHEYVFEKIIDETKSIAEDTCLIASSYKTVRYGNIYDNLARIYDFDVHTPWNKLPELAKKVFLYGTEKKWTRMRFVHPVTGSFWNDLVQWRGVLYEAYDRYLQAKSDNYKRKQEVLMHLGICTSCKGARIQPYPAATEFQGKKIYEITNFPIEEALKFFEEAKNKLSYQDAIVAKELLNEICSRLEFLNNVGLEYLQLSRSSPTLSGGEAQRVRLASQIGSGLVGVTYILDEPSIGLHPVDNKKLIHSLKNLRNKNNTVIVVEHDEEMIRASDHIVDFGPKAGLQGGEIIYSGSLKGLLADKKSLTGAYLSKRKEIAIPKKRRKGSGKYLKIIDACHNNLKNVSAEIPLGCLVGVTGVSGSGKSSLLLETLFCALSNKIMGSEMPCGSYKTIEGYDLIDKVIEIDQSPIGRTPRSNPATYIGLFDEIRILFTKLPQSLARGYKAGRFSFNVKEGSCLSCNGLGMIKVDMDFLEDSFVECPMCQGMRFDQETLSVRFKEKNIRDVLEMSVEEALSHFETIPSIATKLKTLMQVGLDYIKLGQSATTLSGGEAQRIKLARELSRPATGKTIYILDEPTTGLHFYDIQHLLEVLHVLVDKGNTVVVIEHNMDLVKTCDWVIDMGPKSGAQGGEIIATGTPETLAKKRTPTGIGLKEIIDGHQPLAEKSKRRSTTQMNTNIIVKGAAQNNLKSCNVEIERNKMTVVTGPSGSGKSSFAFETIYAEGQRRYVESLSPYVRQFVKQCQKPKVESIEGLSPTVAIEARLHSVNPRSTVGTMTEVYDYLRILFSRLGIAHCPKTGYEIRAISKDHVVEKILSYPQDERIYILAPVELKRQDRFEDILERLQKQGFLRIRLNNELYELGQDTKIPFDAKRKNELFLIIDRFKVDQALKMRMLEAVEAASTIGKGKLTVYRQDAKNEKEQNVLFNLAFAVEETGESYPEITPHTFAFNTPQGMCHVCQGLGFLYGIDLTSLPGILDYTPSDLLSLFFARCPEHPYFAHKLFDRFLKARGISAKTTLGKLTQDERQELLAGSKEPIICDNFHFHFCGFNAALTTASRFHTEETPFLPEEWLEALKENRCAACDGTRLNPLARAVTICNQSIADVCRLPLDQAKDFIANLTINYKDDLSLKQVHEELIARIDFLNRIGLTYLSLERSAPSLSGGEAQRVRLARQIGSGLTGVLYVLDEPTIGLHPQDTVTLLEALDSLKANSNTLLVVEHDPQIIMKADNILEFGPGSGKFGGEIVHQGEPNELMNNPLSLTGKYMKAQTVKRERILEHKSAKKNAFLNVISATSHNLKNLSVQIPLNCFVTVTGVSGSGKSTLLFDVLKEGFATISGSEKLSDVIVFDQRPIGQTKRSDIATYMDILTPMRYFFAQLPEASVKGLEPKNFSTYHRKGMCTHCYGLGYKNVEMHFLPPVKITCPECKGLRLNPLSLSVRYQEKNLGQILQMTCEEVRALFINHSRIIKRIDMLLAVGLGYLNLGQETQTVSGGEAQRLKLSYELAKRTKGPTLYLLDEPTTGLHGQEIEKILIIIDKLVEKGHSVIAIEHNLDFIAASDHVIDLGPGAGDKGGKLVCQGTPQEVAMNKKSVTGKFLHERFFLF